VALSLALGLSVFVDHSGIVSEMTAINQQIIWNIRLPRVLTAMVSGGALALSGVLLQTLLRNPLADPYVLGVSGGGSVAALLVMLFGISYLLCLHKHFQFVMFVSL